MKNVKRWDAIVVGAGIIGLSLAIELRKGGMSVLIVEKGEPGREASHAAGGMLADFPLELLPALHQLATGSALMYPEFVHELEDESGLKIDLRSQGTLLLPSHQDRDIEKSYPLPASLPKLEPALQVSGRVADRVAGIVPLFLKERCVDPRDLTAAAIAAAKHRGIDFSSGDEVLAVEIAQGKAAGVRTNKTHFSAGVVITCAGAWAGKISPHAFPTRPVKGQMLSVATSHKELLRHVVRSPDVYLIPRSDGRLVIGSTQEEAGFDKQTVPATLQRLRQAALDLVPQLAEARILEAWAGLRPGTPDNLPILGATPTPGYFVATGHFRDGILLAPATAKVMGQVIVGQRPAFDLKPFGSERFRS